MKVLWICNTPLPCVARDLGETPKNVEGWRIEIAEMFQEMKNMQLIICFPHLQNKKIMSGVVNKLKYYSIEQKYTRKAKYNSNDEESIRYIIDKEIPDVIHIWGSEFPHALAAARACKSLNIENRAIVSVQGLVSIYAKHYTLGLPQSMLYAYHPLDLLYSHSISMGKKRFVQRGGFEEELYRVVPNVIGRTDWDKACTFWMNKSRNYYFCNETLREEFYTSEWDFEQCRKNSIFVSQAYYSIKGFHYFINAVKLLIPEFPDMEIRIAGKDFIRRKSIREWLLSDSYANYVRKLIKRNHLEKHIHFLGGLTAAEMKTEYLHSNVFVSPSLIENSPNSVGEAMILGTPVITSDVGGVKNLLEHEKEGLIYPADESYVLAYYIRRILMNPDFAKSISKAARVKASKTHNKIKNFEQLQWIYNTINKTSSSKRVEGRVENER